MGKYPLQETALAVVVGTPLLATVCTGLRLASRRANGAALLADDWLVVAATILSLALIVPSWMYIKMWHVGIHIYDVPAVEMEPPFGKNYQVQLAFNLINYLILPLVKASIIMLLLRLGHVIKVIRNILYVLLGVVVAACIIPWFIMLFMCPPRTGNTWASTTFGGVKCVDRLQIGELQIFITCFSLLTDLLVLPLPFAITHRLMSLSFRSRLAIGAIFMSTLAITAISSAKIYLTYRDRLYIKSSIDWTYPIVFTVNHFENNVAILVSCIPTFRGLYTRWLKRNKPTTSGYSRSTVPTNASRTYPSRTYQSRSKTGHLPLNDVEDGLGRKEIDMDLAHLGMDRKYINGEIVAPDIPRVYRQSRHASTSELVDKPEASPY